MQELVCFHRHDDLLCQIFGMLRLLAQVFDCQSLWIEQLVLREDLAACSWPRLTLHRLQCLHILDLLQLIHVEAILSQLVLFVFLQEVEPVVKVGWLLGFSSRWLHELFEHLA